MKITMGPVRQLVSATPFFLLLLLIMPAVATQISKRSVQSTGFSEAQALGNRYKFIRSFQVQIPREERARTVEYDLVQENLRIGTIEGTVLDVGLDGTVLREAAVPLLEDRFLYGLTVDNGGRVYSLVWAGTEVVDVIVSTTDLQYLETIRVGFEVRYPAGITCDPNRGVFYISDDSGDQVHETDSEFIIEHGKFVGRVCGESFFMGPAFNPNDETLFIGDQWRRGHVSEVFLDGTLGGALDLGDHGSFPGDVAFDPTESMLYVLQRGGLISVFHVDSTFPPQPIERCPATPTPTISATPSPTPSVTPTLPCDPGAHLLTSNGWVFELGEPPDLDLSDLPASSVSVDLEKARLERGEETRVDVALLDGAGVVSFIHDPANNVPQDFLLEVNHDFPRGRAVDLELTPTSAGFYVLTDFGSIYRAGDARGNGESNLVPGTEFSHLGYDVPLGDLRAAGFPARGASLRAVAFLPVRQPGSQYALEGFIILDSQGGRILVNLEESTHPLLSPQTNWPFFPGLDICRDLDIHPSGEGCGVLDGWGGIHPIPAGDPDNAVFFLRNERADSPGENLTTVGMPYIVAGFDDPTTPEDESDPTFIGSDVTSIFADFEFSERCRQGFYTLDRFGLVYAFGESRAHPSRLAPFWSSPFLPTLVGADLEVYSGEEHAPVQP